MQLRAIAKSSHAIDGRIIERPSTSLGHGWFHLRSSAWPRHFFIRRRVFISRAESGGRGEGGDIARIHPDNPDPWDERDLYRLNAHLNDHFWRSR